MEKSEIVEILEVLRPQFNIEIHDTSFMLITGIISVSVTYSQVLSLHESDGSITINMKKSHIVFYTIEHRIRVVIFS